MKIRKGFVSNSSSSSFIIGFARKPTSAEELHSWMFPDGTVSIAPYGDNGLTSNRAAEIVYNDILKQDPLTHAEIAEDAAGGTPYTDIVKFPKWPSDFWKLKGEAFRAAINKYEKDKQAAADKLAGLLCADDADLLFYLVSYADDDGGIWSDMEHGNIFRNIPGIHISHH